jgi:hypothetical protein
MPGSEGRAGSAVGRSGADETAAVGTVAANPGAASARVGPTGPGAGVGAVGCPSLRGPAVPLSCAWTTSATRRVSVGAEEGGGGWAGPTRTTASVGPAGRVLAAVAGG